MKPRIWRLAYVNGTMWCVSLPAKPAKQRKNRAPVDYGEPFIAPFKSFGEAVEFLRERWGK